ncbi:adenylyl cyclase-associated protein 1 [Limosa lapponica baueri]|uniref:Adenylyl cyclase-associated protein n=1 Tax=Limosa lapponica baueri TaxID=1758121 RepID=A0A2I0TAU4_LIMLA|nr:adenylyl cyclase-associated protein 1 [Limosa lapponica baueri]
MERLVERLEKAVERLETVCQGPGMCRDGSSKGVAQYVQAFDALLAGPVAEYIKISKEVGGDVQKHETYKLPSPRAVPLLDKKHVDWVKAYLSIWTELQAYIKEYHTTGLTWSKTGPVATEGTKSPSAPPAGAAPPPPGPPPPPAPAPTSSSTDDSASRSALFAQINRGEGITSGLRHVSDDMKTHKNPALKNQGGPVRSGPKPFTAPKPGCNANPSPKTSPKAPALLELEGKKWRVENQENATNLVISDTELKQVAYVFKCTNSTLQIKGKINSITLDNCKKLGLVFDDVVGIVEIINSRDIKVQVMGKVPTISINKTDGCHVYLSKNSLDCEIVSAKSSEMNVLIPTEGGDFTEFPVPEQFKTVWNGQKLVTTVTEIAG